MTPKGQQQQRDIETEIRNHLKVLNARIPVLRYDQLKCTNENADLKRFYAGRIEEIEREALFLSGLLQDD